MPRAALVSFRLGCHDGVSVEAEKWSWALEQLGFETVGVAGAGTPERLVPGLAIGATSSPSRADVEDALGDADVVVVENLCSLPLNPAGAGVVAGVLAGRPAILHHHDLPWQRPQFEGWPPPPVDPSWRHVTINERSRRELAAYGIEATTVYNAFDPDPPPGRRAETRAALGVAPDARLVLQPTRALARKRVDAAVRVAERLGATYWLLGPAEDGYGPELQRVLAGARCPVRHGTPRLAHGGAVNVADAYAACDVVALTSSAEGFGNPALEAATHRRPLVIGPYPVAAELAGFGFTWFTESAQDLRLLEAWLDSPEPALVEHNASVARQNFSLASLPAKLSGVLASPGWVRRERASRSRHGMASARPRELRTDDMPRGGPSRRLSGDERRRQLSTVALRIFAARGYESATMDEIADAAGVTKPLLYQHFSSKRALYRELVDSVAEELLHSISAATRAACGPREQVENGFEAYFRMVVTHETAFRLLYSRSLPTDPELGAALSRVEDAIAVAIDPLIAAGLDPAHRRLLAHAVAGMAEGAGRHWIETRGEGPDGSLAAPWPGREAQQLGRRIAELAWAGLRAVHPD